MAETMTAHIHVRTSTSIKDEVTNLKDSENRTESAMVNILLREALDARAVRS